MFRLYRFIVVTLLIAAGTGSFGAQAPAQSGAQPAAPVLACDRLAAHPADTARVVDGVAWDLVDGRAAVRACEDAVQLHPQELRFQYQLGRALLRANRRDEGLPYLFDVAEKGYLAAFANIGGTYQFDLGNLAEALKWYRRGADLDDVSSQTHLAEMYLEGWGVKRDLTEALRWFMPSASRGYALSEYKVGLVYQQGDSKVPRDMTRAVEWFSKAAAKGFARAQNDLGVLYEKGDGVPRDEREAARWYRLAAEQGWALGQINLAFLYENGKGVGRNLEEAFYWYRLATQARRDDLASTARNGVDRTRKRLSSGQIASVDNRIDAWRSLSQEESVVAVRASSGAGASGNVASLEETPERTSAVDPVYTPPPGDDVDTSYRPGGAEVAAVAKPAEPLSEAQREAAGSKPADPPAAELERPDIVPEFAIYTAATNANIRAAPAAGAGRIGGLRRGEKITVLGRVVGKNWVMVSTQDERIGYVFGDLVRSSTQVALQAPPKPDARSPDARSPDAQNPDAQNPDAQNPDAAAPTLGTLKKPQETSPAAEPVDVPGLGRYHALVIGINAYQHLPRLETAINDARVIGDVLAKDYGYKVNLLLDATRADIIRALDDYRKSLTDKDNLLIYYAGHGYLDTESDRGFWLPVDASGESQVSWLSNVTITDSLKAIEAKHAMLIVDSCYSGTLTRGLKVTLRGPEAEQKLAQKRVRVVLTSGGLEPVVDGGGGNHSVFAKAVLEALRSNKGRMKGTELALQVRRPVMLAANQTPDYADLRFAGHEGGDFVFAARPQ
ncbi:caspase family protein [Denitrobaculum tricleocarpae]|uniref:SH3 domain-containing protein n=1 Tax=Denitrobaculum tricleocarpae TaxID=2591009 RepID=A0A545TT88_9PROT|nr:caspase family protein [Denitrobaculum tricleocarpae]TQV80435.1 SH3 domain-containing protein [Denitrobaculum tricleocarpae]